MINRQLLRNKVVQVLYSNMICKGEYDIHNAEKELEHSIDKSNDLYHALLLLTLQITEYAERLIDDRMNKLMPTEEEKNPNLRFVRNRFAAQLRENNNLNEYMNSFSFSWYDYPEVMKELYSKMVSSDYYINYMESSDSNYEMDKDLWRWIFKKLVPTVETLADAIEECSIYWIEDIDIVLSYVVKTTKLFNEEMGENQPLLLHSSHVSSGEKDKYLDEKEEMQEEDIAYACKLVKTVMLNNNKYDDMITEVIKNWDYDRLVFMDTIILKAALAELLSFPTIPVSVTMNEYIEMSKFYGTSKSSVFINGVLDKIVAKLKEEHKLQKLGL